MEGPKSGKSCGQMERQAELSTNDTPWISLEASLLLQLHTGQPEDEKRDRNS